MRKRKSNLNLHKTKTKRKQPKVKLIPVCIENVEVTTLSSAKRTLTLTPKKSTKRRYSPFKSPASFRSPLYRASPKPKKLKHCPPRSLFSSVEDSNFNVQKASNSFGDKCENINLKAESKVVSEEESVTFDLTFLNWGDADDSENIYNIRREPCHIISDGDDKTKIAEEKACNVDTCLPIYDTEFNTSCNFSEQTLREHEYIAEKSDNLCANNDSYEVHNAYTNNLSDQIKQSPGNKDTYKSVSTTTEEMQRLLPSVMQKLSEENRLDEVILAFFQQIQSGMFPTDNIAFLLWTDVVRWYQCQNTTHMRYSSDTKMFWKLGWKIFGGRFVRFMGGFKNEAELVQEKSTKSKHSPISSKVNFIVPDQKVLRRFDPFNVDGEKQPGIYTDVMEKISLNMNHRSACLTFDGKKIKQGLTPNSGDVNLLGFENGLSLEDRQCNLQMKLDETDVLINQLNCLKVGMLDARQLPEEATSDLIKTLLTQLKAISISIHSVKDIKKKKEYCKLKLIERGGESDWRKGKYVYAISAIIAFIHDIDEFLRRAATAVDTICRCVSFLNGAKYVTGSHVNLGECSTYFEIQTDDTDEGNSRLIKQRSEKWFQIRSLAKVTGSTLFKALGLDGLQKQKEHFEKVVCNVPEKEPSPEVEAAMKHGTENELNAVATIIGKIMPVICPEVVFCEEGCVEVKGPDNKTFMVVSPDGSLRTDTHLHSNKMAVEIKCPVYKVHTEFPARYMLQCLSEIEVLDVDSLLYVSWTKDESTAFRIERDSALFQKAMRLALQIYGAENPKKPTKMYEEAKVIKDEIVTKSKRVEMIGQFPSVSVGTGVNDYAVEILS